jgi:hypothetical protein
MSPIHTLKTLQHSEDRNGPFQLYIFDRAGYHRGGRWFRTATPKYPDEEITIQKAKLEADEAIKKGFEVRICDGGDMLVYHNRGGKCLHGEAFWKDLGQ